MKKGLVDISELRLKKDQADYYGKSAYCFLVGKQIIKIYADKSDKNFHNLDRSKICDLSMYKSKNIMFPIKYLYEKSVVNGEISRFVSDKSLTDGALNDKSRIITLLKNYRLILSEMNNYSNIAMNDLCSVNILYSGKNGFSIIDTTEWELNDKNNSDHNAYLFNLSLFSTLMDYLGLPSFVHHFMYSEMCSYILCNKDIYGKLGEHLYNNICDNLCDDYRIVEFFEIIGEMYQKYYNEEMTTLNDIKKYTKMMKNS